ncbi:secreted RxLR effector protein 161-like [Aristolochia californica]|uniref:secreted RxLR effector protein 161-like n=1 Tax=Aristolochia californica TaxID=171875 RepID=UPI0035DAAA0E
MDSNTKLCGDTGEDVDIGKYQILLGRLMYLCVTRPDISYAVCVVSQYMHKPQLSHWQALERILRYLKESPGRGLLYKSHGHFYIEGFSDADWVASPDDRKSTWGFFFHERTKHIEVECHLIQEKFQAGFLSLRHISSQNQVADILTKSVTHKLLSTTCNKLGIYDVFSPPT